MDGHLTEETYPPDIHSSGHLSAADFPSVWGYLVVDLCKTMHGKHDSRTNACMTLNSGCLVANVAGNRILEGEAVERSRVVFCVTPASRAPYEAVHETLSRRGDRCRYDTVRHPTHYLYDNRPFNAPSRKKLMYLRRGTPKTRVE